VVQDFVRTCAVCQRNKTEHLQPGGLLQPLDVPTTVWADVAMDFVEALPKVNGKTVILTVVDRFSKAAHFIPLSHPYTATSVARVFFAEVVRLHGILSSIVSDRDPVFTSSFWGELFRLAGVKLRFTSAFHPQSDGQSEATNRVIAMYLRCLTGDRPRNLAGVVALGGILLQFLLSAVPEDFALPDCLWEATTIHKVLSAGGCSLARCG
jgi:hypothetical protein